MNFIRRIWASINPFKRTKHIARINTDGVWCGAKNGLQNLATEEGKIKVCLGCIQAARQAVFSKH